MKIARVSAAFLLGLACAAPAALGYDTRPATAAAQPHAMSVGGMVVRLEEFVEMRDGSIHAQISFRNPDAVNTATLAMNARMLGGQAEYASYGQEPVLHLVNARGSIYRLTEMSRIGDMQSGNEWIAVPPGGSTFVSAVFTPEGAGRGQQPFTLSVPLRMQWRADTGEERARSFQVNFKGLHRADFPAYEQSPDLPPIQASPAGRVEQAALTPPQAPISAPRSILTPPPVVAGFDDDLAPRIAAMIPAHADPHRFLFAVGVEQYDDAPNVPFADRSAHEMSDLLSKRYGIPEENVTLITGADATGMKILGRLNSLIQRLSPTDTVYFYYAGHGLAARDGSSVYLVPKDAVPGAYQVEMLSLSSLLQRFEQSKAARVIAFLDTCFSGRVSHDQTLFPGVAPLIPTPLPATAATTSGKATVFLAGQSYQFANDYPEHGHRLFSYFLMRGLLDGRDDAASLSDYVTREVRRVSAKRGADYLQEPQLQGATLSLADGARRVR
jgi:hypothetical protein